MITVIGKPSQDPIQEKLRQNKKIWNKQVSDFADNIFRLKDLMNGKPSKFYPEKSAIKEPIPGDPITIINNLANQFQEIAQKGNSIINQQLDYSKTRRKKQPKSTIPTANTVAPKTTPSLNLSEQLSASIEEYELFALASNPFSRFFARLLNSSFGDSPKSRTKKYRMSLLKSAADSYKDCNRLQAAITKSSPESIFEASKILSKIEGNLNFFKVGLFTYKESLKNSKEKTNDIAEPINKENITNPVPAPVTNAVNPADNVNQQVVDTSTVDYILSEYKKYFSSFMDIDFKKLTSLLAAYRTSKNKNNEELISKIKSEYNDVLAKINAKYGTNGNSLKQILELKKIKANRNLDQLEAIGQQAIKKWLGKIKHQISPFDKTSAHRLDIYKLIEKIKKIINEIMNSLEKEMNIDNLIVLFEKVFENLSTIKYLMAGLESTLYGKGLDKSFIDLLESGKITNFDPNLSPVQKEHLQKMIERVRLKDLTNLYQGRNK